MCYFFVSLCHLSGKYSNDVVYSTIRSYATSQLYLFQEMLFMFSVILPGRDYLVILYNATGYLTYKILF